MSVTNMVTKKNTLLVCASASMILLTLNWIGTFRLCGAAEYGTCMDNLYAAMIVFTPILPFTLLAFIVYFLRDEVFQTWIKFALVWVPLTMFLTLLAPEYSNSLLSIVKSSVSFWFSATFLVVSLVIIIVRSSQLRAKK